ncbi:hypothetical protein TTHERM_000094319 (macronuclear) [Tetrahymena thermophila SB210]|uniref:Uncharacterized protein n=1 Tax=Tetrahymena thermophila (strain SB210) TaxID=312017 RepID=W7XEN3_TETTS|nr:hypothetical protein TTHERM_000094319 [Tetrahymena thermophila SB210]EWS75178.1 hypothetical protein TTHERM_000094319 [Tetrahymena thermophila SB210]|eukprot:XP_012652169.1 hypothetical protein TTHERM_000094319 [Tetrahymena thermophila SB210]
MNKSTYFKIQKIIDIFQIAKNLIDKLNGPQIFSGVAAIPVMVQKLCQLFFQQQINSFSSLQRNYIRIIHLVTLQITYTGLILLYKSIKYCQLLKFLSNLISYSSNKIQKNDFIYLHSMLVLKYDSRQKGISKKSYPQVYHFIEFHNNLIKAIKFSDKQSLFVKIRTFQKQSHNILCLVKKYCSKFNIYIRISFFKYYYYYQAKLILLN